MKKNTRILTLVFVVAFLTLLTGCLPTPTPPNETPIITSDPITTATVGVLYTYNVNATDPDDDALTYSLIIKPSGMIINSVTGVIFWTPVAAQVGNNSVTVKVSDGFLSITQGFIIKVSKPSPTPINQAPIIYSTPVTTATVWETYIYDVNATDQDGDTLNYSLTTKPSGMFINSVNGLIWWVPTSVQVGNNLVTVNVSDGALSDTQSFIIRVSESSVPPVNQAPIIVSTPITVATVGIGYVYDVNAFDPEGDILTYSLTIKPGGMTINSATGVISWIPTSAQVENNTVKVGASDGVLSDTQNFTIVVSEPTVPLETYTITATAGPGGSITPSGVVTVDEGSDKVFTITPDSILYSIEEVLVDGNLVEAVSPYAFTNVTEDHTIHATFTLKLLGFVYNQDKEQYYNNIQLAIDDADAGNTILVAAGTYNENVVIGESLTLFGANAGVCAGVDSGTRGDESIVDAFEISADDVVIDGFQINGGVTGTNCLNAIYLLANTSGHTISNNILPGPGGTPPAGTYRGIEFGYTISDTTVTCNEIYGWVSGIYINPPGSDHLLFQYNDIHHNWAGIGSDGLNDVSILNNNFSHNVEGFGSSNVGINVEAHSNNFTDNDEAGIRWYIPDVGNNINAIDNWWGDASGPTHSLNPTGTGDIVSDNVDYSNWSTSQN